MNETPPSRRPSTRALAWLLVPLVLVLAGAFAWHAWRQQQARLHDRNADQARQLETLIARMDNLRSDLATQSRLIRDASNANRVLRDEVLGLGQRNALLEDNVARLAASSRDGSRSARLDEAELLLVMGAQRLRIAGDVEGARRAYALAASLLEGLHDPDLLNLRQTLAEERAALDRLGPGPRAAIAARLDAVAARLADLPLEAPAADEGRPQPWWQRALAPLVQVRPAGSHELLTGSERIAAETTLQLELTLARAALERGDAPAFGSALQRAQAAIRRLWPDSPALREVQGQLQALRGQPLELQEPVLEATLLQLRAAREARSVQ
ncbi:uroporphyrinogen-III C-methyltransferase [Pseudoxanthomonas sp. GW2]|uniref:uroporphyrinogen-III C-methyltransferase n=1 Tax=Pseudoxanthomonas sp. GW2 TaxID=1211114 RepID=UPI00035D3C24|nr:uroporphyrinogen-III C-methyltransferase [Pseudoxanthomonas sp. GW2]